jgi:hypothetical protein
MDEVRQSLEPKISHMLTDYQTYKDTHDALLKIPFIKHLLENQCKCRPVVHEPIQLEIIDVDIAAEQVGNLPNLDSISEYINATIESDTEKESSASEEEEEEASSEEDEALVEAEDEDETLVEEEEETLVEEEAEEEEDETLVEEEEETLVEAEDEDEEEAETLVEAEEEPLVEEEDEEEAETLVEETLVEETLVEEEESVAEEEDEELELFEVVIKGKTYVTSDETDGDIYEYVKDEVGEIVGTFKNGVAKFIKKSKTTQKK